VHASLLTQFIETTVRVGSGIGGRKAITKSRHRNAIASKFTTRPTRLPMLKRDGNSGLPYTLRQMMHKILMMYDIVRVPVPKLATLLNAAVLPMLMSAMITATMNEMMSALTGISDRGRIYEYR